MAALTSDIVWLETQVVTLPDGSQQTALVPKVYLMPRPGDLAPDGSLIAGRQVQLNLSGALRAIFKGGEAVKMAGATAEDAQRAASAAQGGRLKTELGDWAKMLPDTSRDAEYLAKTDRQVLQQNNFDMDHVLTGEVNAKGKATGYHAEFAAEGEARIQPGAEIKYNANGTYEAPVQIWDAAKGAWVDKVRNSTFFPPSWSQARIEYEVSEAFKSKQMLDATKWQGTSPSGVVIEGFVTPTRTTFYPTK